MPKSPPCLDWGTLKDGPEPPLATHRLLQRSFAEADLQALRGMTGAWPAVARRCR
jgi:hypothetical protein